jgi:glycosyltransferase involved in cell wall biosynthesis
MLTIIIPVYNVEKYIRACLESATKDDKNIEYIIVNDGSKDNSMTIVSEYYSKNHNLKIINKANGGLSDARNEGLKNATGDYVAFIDSDDQINLLELIKLYEFAVTNSLDVCYGNFLRIDELGKPIESNNKSYHNVVPFHIYKGTEFCYHAFNGKSLDVMAWRGVYRTAFLEKNEIRFIKKLIHEDIIFTFEVLRKADFISLIDVKFYYYRQREGSIVRTVNQNRINSLLYISKRILEENKPKDYSYKVWNVYNKYMTLYILRSYKHYDKQSITRILLKSGISVRLFLVMLLSLPYIFISKGVDVIEYK